MIDPVNTDALRETAGVASEVADARGLGWRALADSAEALIAAADEVDRLRALIKTSAPHDGDCHLYLTWYERERRCTCWKASI